MTVPLAILATLALMLAAMAPVLASPSGTTGSQPVLADHVTNCNLTVAANGDLSRDGTLLAGAELAAVQALLAANADLAAAIDLAAEASVDACINLELVAGDPIITVNINADISVCSATVTINVDGSVDIGDATVDAELLDARLVAALQLAADAAADADTEACVVVTVTDNDVDADVEVSAIVTLCATIIAEADGDFTINGDLIEADGFINNSSETDFTAEVEVGVEITSTVEADGGIFVQVRAFDLEGCGATAGVTPTPAPTPPTPAEPETGMLMIMKHYCNADDSNPDTTVDVRSEEEFMEVEAGGGGDEVIAVALTILACPVERLPGDEPAPDSIAHFEEEFDFLVTDSTGGTFTLADATFNVALVCEQDKTVASGPDPIVIGEVDGDDATNVCVDFSFYSIEGVAEGEVTVTETFHEGEHEFGTVRFTPSALDPDDDSRTLLDNDRETSTVVIDTSLDDDAMVMLHIYNFDTAGDAAPAPTATPVASELPDAAVNPTGEFGSSSVAILFGIMALASIGFLGLRTVAVRRNR